MSEPGTSGGKAGGGNAGGGGKPLGGTRRTVGGEAKLPLCDPCGAGGDGLIRPLDLVVLAGVVGSSTASGRCWPVMIAR